MKCLNKNVVIGLAAIALVVLVLKPSWLLAALPLLVLAACPLSMMFMMRTMSSQSGNASSCGTSHASGAPAKAEHDLGREIRSLQAQLRALKTGQAHRTTPDAATTNK